MSRSATGYPRKLLRRIVGAVVVVGLVFAAVTLRQLVRQELAIDELTYAHAGWAIANGQLPYRDFFFHHTPLLLQGLAGVFTVLDDDPTGILWVRLGMLIPLLTLLWAGYRLNRPLGRLEALSTPVLILMTWPFVRAAVEIRPDNLAFALFLAALVVLARGRKPGDGSIEGAPWRRGVVAALLVGAAVWASEKVLAYGSVFALGGLVDLVRLARHRAGDHGGGASEKPRYLLGHPVAFVGGFGVAALAAVAYLALTGSLDDFWRWGVEWSILHERHYPGFSWRHNFGTFSRDYWWLFPVMLLGVARSVQRLTRAERPWSHSDLLLIPTLVTTWMSFAVQTAPHYYSLVPFLGLFAIFTARGLGEILHRLAAVVDSPSKGRAATWALAGLGFLLLLTAVFAVLRLRELPTNEHQLELLATVGEITTPEDPVFDSTGSYVTRPHVSFFFFNDETARELLGDRLSREIPQAIVARGCTVAWRDHRFLHQPPAIKDFLFAHFQPYDDNGKLWLWGRAFTRGDRPVLVDRFLAVRTGRYFVEPADVLADGRLTVDGHTVTEPVFQLEKGLRQIVYEGPAPAFRLLWLPRNGETFHPDPNTVRFYWPLRYRGLPRFGEEDPLARTDLGQPAPE